jgi:hypothetical protein
MTSPDHSIVTFDLFGVSYLYEGSTRSVDIISGSEVVPLKPLLDNKLSDMVTQHIPANEQIETALMQLGFLPPPEIKYTEDQPEDNLSPDALT